MGEEGHQRVCSRLVGSDRAEGRFVDGLSRGRRRSGVFNYSHRLAAKVYFEGLLLDVGRCVHRHCCLLHDNEGNRLAPDIDLHLPRIRGLHGPEDPLKRVRHDWLRWGRHQTPWKTHRLCVPTEGVLPWDKSPPRPRTSFVQRPQKAP